MKRKHLDFILYEDCNEKLVFRFYPRKSHCHSFNDNPPRSWKEVYKVYYAYSVFKIYKDDGTSRTLFKCDCDECSVIGEIAARIALIYEDETRVTYPVVFMEHDIDIDLLNSELFPIGDGVSWIIKNLKQPGYYEVILWQYDNTGYRFCLEKDNLKNFGLYLQKCCEYMLAHGEPI